MTIKFKPAEVPDPTKGFRMGAEQSVFVNNVSFTITGVRYGNYEVVNDDGSVSQTKFADKSQSILFTTSVGEDIPLNRLLKKRRVLYNADGTAKVVESCDFKAPLREHLESLGRRSDDSAMLNGNVEAVGNHALKFFEGKTIICQEVDGLARDDKNRLVPLLSPCIIFTFKE